MPENIDVSKISVYSGFPAMLKYQDVDFSFAIPAWSHTYTAGSAAGTDNIYTYEDSTPIDKANGIANVLVSLDATQRYDHQNSQFTSFRQQIKAGANNYYDVNYNDAASTVNKMQDGPTVGGGFYFGMSILNWFDDGNIYTKIDLNIYHPVPAINVTVYWKAQNVRTEAVVSLLPY